MQLSLSNQEADRECITAHPAVSYQFRCGSPLVESGPSFVLKRCGFGTAPPGRDGTVESVDCSTVRQ